MLTDKYLPCCDIFEGGNEGQTQGARCLSAGIFGRMTLARRRRDFAAASAGTMTKPAKNASTVAKSTVLVNFWLSRSITENPYGYNSLTVTVNAPAGSQGSVEYGPIVPHAQVTPPSMEKRYARA